MNKLFANPTVRLAARALVAAAIVALTQIHASGGTIAWRSLAVGAALAFVEVFTPLNALVGVFKSQTPTTP
jgi:hypothetical protein